MEKPAIKPHFNFPVIKTFMLLGIVGLICLSVAFILSFRVVDNVRENPFPKSRQTSNLSLIQGWMTVRYIAHTYNVPEQQFIDELAMTVNDINRFPLEKMAKKRHETTNILIEKIKQIIITYQSAHEMPSP